MVTWYHELEQPRPLRRALVIIGFHFWNSGHLLALDENIYQLRLDKLKQIEALGQRIYPTKYEFTHTIPQILAGRV